MSTILMQRREAVSLEVIACLAAPKTFLECMNVATSMQLNEADFDLAHRDVFSALVQQYYDGLSSPNVNLLSTETAQSVYDAGSMYEFDMFDNFEANCRRLIEFEQAIRVAAAAKAGIYKLEHDASANTMFEVQQDIDEAFSAGTNLRRNPDTDLSDMSAEFWRARAINTGNMVPTGIASYDARHRGYRRGQIFGAMGIYKSGKSRVLMNATLSWLTHTHRLGAYVRRFMGDMEAVDCDDLRTMHSRDWCLRYGERVAADEVARTAFGVARVHFFEQRDYRDTAVAVFLLEKNRQQFLDGLAASMAIDFLYGANANKLYAAITRDERLAPYAKEPDPKHGYYHAPDWFEDTTPFTPACAIGVDEMDKSDVNDWGIRRIALQMAMEYIETNFGNRIRVFDRTPRAGNVQSFSDVERIIRADQRDNRDGTLISDIKIDYISILGAPRARNDVDRMEYHSIMLPELVNGGDLSCMVAMQRTNASMKHEDPETVPHDPMAIGGQYGPRMLDRGVIVYPYRITGMDDDGERVGDMRLLKTRNWGGRDVQRDNEWYFDHVHAKTGRAVIPSLLPENRRF